MQISRSTEEKRAKKCAKCIDDSACVVGGRGEYGEGRRNVKKCHKCDNRRDGDVHDETGFYVTCYRENKRSAAAAAASEVRKIRASADSAAVISSRSLETSQDGPGKLVAASDY